MESSDLRNAAIGVLSVIAIGVFLSTAGPKEQAFVNGQATHLKDPLSGTLYSPADIRAGKVDCLEHKDEVIKCYSQDTGVLLEPATKEDFILRNPSKWGAVLSMSAKDGTKYSVIVLVLGVVGWLFLPNKHVTIIDGKTVTQTRKVMNMIGPSLMLFGVLGLLVFNIDGWLEDAPPEQVSVQGAGQQAPSVVRPAVDKETSSAQELWSFLVYGSRE